MDDDAGGVDDAAQRRPERRPQARRGAALRWRAAAASASAGVARRRRARQRRAEAGGRRAQRVDDGRAAESRFERADRRRRWRSCSIDGMMRKSVMAVAARGGLRIPSPVVRCRAPHGADPADADEPGPSRNATPRHRRRRRRPSTGRSSASGRTSICPSSRPTRSWRRSIPDSARGAVRPPAAAVLDHARVSAASRAPTTRGPWSWRKRSAEYREVGPRRALPPPRPVLRRATSPRLRDLLAIVGGRHDVEVLIDDRPVPYARELWLPLLWFLLFR